MNVPISTVIQNGWTLCWNSTFSNMVLGVLESNVTYQMIQNNCSGSYIMFAAAAAGNSTLLLLGAAEYGSVFGVTSGTQTNYANGLEWYFSNGMMGFSLGGTTINITTNVLCDSLTGFDWSRLCWFGSGNIIGAGSRIGSAQNINSSDFRRLIFTSGTSNANPSYICRPCTAGQYQYQNCTKTSNTGCSWCPSGYYCPFGSLQPILCPAGFYCPYGSQSYNQNYYPSGPQQNVSISTVTAGGWTLCWTSTYADYGVNINQVMSNNCTGNYLMLAGGVAGSSVLSLLAAGPRGSVIGGTSNTQTNFANGVEWYYTSGTMGFALSGAGQNVTTNVQCDPMNSYEWSRLCWQGSSTTGVSLLNAGGRLGSLQGVNSTAFQRYIFSFGYSSPWGSASMCPAGTYSFAGAGGCSQCPSGYYCPQGSSNYTACPPGYYCPAGSAFYTVPYYPFGPQLNVNISTVTSSGWSLCWSSSFADSAINIQNIMNYQCTGSYLLVATLDLSGGGTSWSTSASDPTPEPTSEPKSGGGTSFSPTTFAMLAAGPRGSVIGGTSNANTNFNNGVEWYFTSGTMGFTLGGTTQNVVTNGQCDTLTGFGWSRMCWQGSNGFTSPGYRVGALQGVNSSQFMRLIYQYPYSGWTCTVCLPGQYASSPCTSSSNTQCSWCPTGYYCPTNTSTPKLCPAGFYCPYGAALFNQSTYYPSGPQQNVSISTVTAGGWTLCWTSTYADYGVNINQVMSNNCTGNYLMLAGGVAGSSVLSLLAAGPRGSVIGGTSNTQTNFANGVEWYYTSGTMGFALSGAGQNVTTNVQCDPMNSYEWSRLCWQGSSTTGVSLLNAGGRLGSLQGVNSTAFQRYIFSFGYSSPWGSASMCPAGTYSFAGAGGCSQCPSGYYCPQGSSNYTACPPGYYCPAGSAFYTVPYYPFGPQLNVNISTVTSSGWSLCWSSSFADSAINIQNIMNYQCTGSYLLVATLDLSGGGTSWSTSASDPTPEPTSEPKSGGGTSFSPTTFAMLAAGPRGSVIGGTSNANTNFNNGVEWYFTSGTMGFTLGGTTQNVVTNGQCDTLTGFGWSRMCWQGSNGFTSPGYRVGALQGVNSSQFMRLIYQYPYSGGWACTVCSSGHYASSPCTSSSNTQCSGCFALCFFFIYL